MAGAIGQNAKRNRAYTVSQAGEALAGVGVSGLGQLRDRDGAAHVLPPHLIASQHLLQPLLMHNWLESWNSRREECWERLYRAGAYMIPTR